ncbi:hypothetical protein [Streptomyces violaceusniger]|uniref:MmyB family transcriptional regulator n=1 Tax=Streptomyces violaceusniger TaxID=68280 RepID=UPI00382FAEAF
MTDLVGELSTRSNTFRQLWARQDVRAYGCGTKRFQHPVVGALDLPYGLLHPVAEPGLTKITYTAAPGTISHDNLSCSPPGQPARTTKPPGISPHAPPSQHG